MEVPVPFRRSAEGSALELLDQTLLPEEVRYLRLEGASEAAEAIRALRVRGAPAIGVVAALGLALEVERLLARDPATPAAELAERFASARDLLASTRPTGRNLGWALGRMEAAFRSGLAEGAPAGVHAASLEADRILELERETCLRIGEAGLSALPGEGVSVLTHCNTGALATGGIGTAVAPIYLARERGIPVRVFALETRPVLQGARLTAWELSRAGIDVTVVPDSAAGSLMSAGEVGAVLVGADRVAANGDVANKIGTYGLAVLAAHHGIPFLVAFPASTVDAGAESGEAIPVEERDPAEVAVVAGRRVVPEGVAVRNPAFDVTPAHLVTAFVTDGGLLRPPFGPALGSLVRSALAHRRPAVPSGEGA